MQYGNEPLPPVLTAISVVFGALAGLAFGIGGFFLATVFPAMLRTALPGMSDAVFLALWSITVVLPLYAFSRVFRKGKGAGTRAYATCGIVAILTLFAGDLTGTISVYPWHTRLYVVPGVIDRPTSPPPAIKR
ncbi:MAG: hypothetical protein M3N49_02640 [Candidatus Eremiobacteraeota bacterium]|nr:hypothetical protein [Candidatus Eremiobacteraeota bacterium]